MASAVKNYIYRYIYKYALLHNSFCTTYSQLSKKPALLNEPQHISERKFINLAIFRG